MTPLTSNYTVDSLSKIQDKDGLYGVMLSAMRNVYESYGDKNRERVALLAHKCLLSATEEFLKQG